MNQEKTPCNITVAGQEYDGFATIGKSSFQGTDYWVAKVELVYPKIAERPSACVADFPCGRLVNLCTEKGSAATGAISSIGPICPSDCYFAIFLVGVSNWS